MKLRVTSIQRGCVNDGPGVRTVVFLKGCVFKCPWCCNPETQSYEEEIFFDRSKCLHAKGINSNLCNGCKVKSGNREILRCPFKAAVPVSKDYTKDELLAEILKDRSLYEVSNGGVTFSGGEPLLHAKQLLPLLIELKKEDVHVAIETTLAVCMNDIEIVMPYIDLWYVDLKLQAEMNNSYNYNLVFENKKKIQTNRKVISFRMVVTDLMADNKVDVIMKLKGLNVKEIELLQCHCMAKDKYVKLYKKCSDFSISLKRYLEFAEYISNEGIDVKLLPL